MRTAPVCANRRCGGATTPGLAEVRGGTASAPAPATRLSEESATRRRVSLPGLTVAAALNAWHEEALRELLDSLAATACLYSAQGRGLRIPFTETAPPGRDSMSMS